MIFWFKQVKSDRDCWLICILLHPNFNNFEGFICFKISHVVSNLLCFVHLPLKWAGIVDTCEALIVMWLRWNTVFNKSFSAAEYHEPIIIFPLLIVLSTATCNPANLPDNSMQISKPESIYRESSWVGRYKNCKI